MPRFRIAGSLSAEPETIRARSLDAALDIAISRRPKDELAMPWAVPVSVGGPAFVPSQPIRQQETR